MDKEVIQLWKNGTEETTLTRFIREDDEVRPAMLVIPGGGYSIVCTDWEGWPIAERFEELGFRTFVLHYRVKPHYFPEPQQDAMRAMKLIRGNAEAWKIFPDNIVACGFSAGGHLAVSLGTICFDLNADNGDAFDKVNAVPDALIASYSVITGGPFSHTGSLKCLMGDETEESIHRFSLEEHVDWRTPPTYIWATQTDGCVPAKNSELFSEAMRKAKRPCELHLYPFGNHGIQFGKGRRDIPHWPEEAARFLFETAGFREPGRTEA